MINDPVISQDGSEETPAPRSSFLDSMRSGLRMDLFFGPRKTPAPTIAATPAPATPARSTAPAIVCPECDAPVSSVGNLKKHMTEKHDGFSDADILAATEPEKTVTVKHSTVHRAIKAHAALAAEAGVPLVTEEDIARGHRE